MGCGDLGFSFRQILWGSYRKYGTMIERYIEEIGFLYRHIKGLLNGCYKLPLDLHSVVELRQGCYSFQGTFETQQLEQNIVTFPLL